MNNKLIYAILGASLIIGIFIYASQVSKQESIERQQQITLVENMRQLEIKTKTDKCEALSAGLVKRWNNVVGVTYDRDSWDECVVTYIDKKTGDMTTSPLSWMEEIK